MNIIKMIKGLFRHSRLRYAGNRINAARLDAAYSQFRRLKRAGIKPNQAAHIVGRVYFTGKHHD